MEPIKVLVQKTPNPNARKFIISREVKTSGKVSFTSMEQCDHVPLAKALFLLTNVTQVHFFENVITVTQNGLSDWARLGELVEEKIHNLIGQHNPDFMSPEEARKASLPPELQKIDAILDEYIRPALQADGGDIEVVELKDSILTVRYEGACGTCPSSTTGTLEAVERLLQEEYDPHLEICIV